MDKGDLGTIVGAIAGGTLVVATTTLGAPWVIGASALGGYIGHNIADSGHYRQPYQKSSYEYK